MKIVDSGYSDVLLVFLVFLCCVWVMFWFIHRNIGPMKKKSNIFLSDSIYCFVSADVGKKKYAAQELNISPAITFFSFVWFVMDSKQ